MMMIIIIATILSFNLKFVLWLSKSRMHINKCMNVDIREQTVSIMWNVNIALPKHFYFCY